MAYEIPGHSITLEASTDLSAYQYRFVVSNGDNTCTLAGNGVAVTGVLQNKPKAGQAASIVVDGVSKVKAHGSTVSAGDVIASSTVGMVSALGAGDYAVGRVLHGSSGSTGRVLTVLLQPIGTT
jgi:hypothetical protein